MAIEMEKVYVNDIHPLVERITLICKQSGMPMFMTFQDGSDSFRTSCVNQENSIFEKLKLHMIVNESWSLDQFLAIVIEDAKKNGHDSLYLSAIGIPKESDTTIKKGG